MRTKITAILILFSIGLFAMQTIEAGESGVITYYQNISNPMFTISNLSDNSTLLYDMYGPYAHICNISTEQSRLIICFQNFEFNSTEIYNITLRIDAKWVNSSGNLSVHFLSYDYSTYIVPHLANWTFTGYLQDWATPGGDFIQEPADTHYIDSPYPTYYYYNITGLTELNDDEVIGIIFQAEYGTNLSFFNLGATSFIFYIHYIDHSQIATNLTKDFWNLEGYANVSPKLASTIFSEISTCRALSWKNATTGYWYTYWPEYGLIEDDYLSFGDGLFILTTSDTTWDHT